MLASLSDLVALAVLATAAWSPADALEPGLAYSYGDEGAATIASRVSRDVGRIRGCAATSRVDALRLYFGSYFGTLVTSFAGFSGMRLLVGFDPRASPEFRDALEADLRAVYSQESVIGMVYLDESVDIASAATFLPSVPRIAGKPVVTSQRTAVDYGVYRLLLSQGFDGIMFNVYPNGVFSGAPPASGDEAFEDFCWQLSAISDYYAASSGIGEHFCGVSETGVPGSQGVDLVRSYWRNIQAFVSGTRSCKEFSYATLASRHSSCWMGVFGFEATTEHDKGTPLENSFGIVDAFELESVTHGAHATLSGQRNILV